MATIQYPSNEAPQTIDLDGDGKQEILIKERPYGALTGYNNSEAVFLNLALTGTTVSKPANALMPFLFADNGEDLNGDGLGDGRVVNNIRNNTVAATHRFYVSNTVDGRPNTIASIRNEIGGVNTFKFTPSTKWTNVFLPFALDTLTEVAADDGIGNIAKQTISYAGGKYDPALRRFLGFRTVTESRPCFNTETTCPTVETTYRQDVASSGAVERRIEKDGAGVIHSDTTETWTVNLATKPYSALNTATTTILSEAGVSSTQKIERAYDTYGNVSLLKDYGRTDVSGDEVMTYAPVTANTSAYIVDKPFQIVKWAGFDGLSPNFIDYHQFVYDGLAFNTAPVRGEITTLRDFQSTSPSYKYTESTYTYDAKGNRISAMDALGNLSLSTYDASGLFVINQTNPKGQSTTFNYGDYACGAPVGKTGIDTIPWTYTYDALCRVVYQLNTFSGASTTTSYTGLGTPGSQYITTSTPGPQGTISQTSKFDGFGKIYLKSTQGVAGGEPALAIETATTYDARGNVIAQTLPHYSDDTAVQSVLTAYDWANRPLKVTNADGSISATAYSIDTSVIASVPNPGLFAETNTDEIGHITKVRKSTQGKVISVSRQISGTAYQVETRSYDVLGRMIGVTDAGGAVWSNVYDMLGNRISATDPDLGTWTYAYDSANRLISQTDARGVKTGMSYDALGRLLERRIITPVVPDPILTANTYDQPKAYFYNIGKLTTSTNANRTQTVDYDANGLVQLTVNGAHIVYEARSVSGHTLYKIYYPGGLYVGTSTDSWQYDALGRLKSIPGMIVSQTYEADGQTKAITYTNGVTTTFTYSPTRHWVLRVTTKNAGGVALIDDAYTRDATGRILTINGLTSPDNWAYTYDGLSRLTSASNGIDAAMNEAFTYAANDNMLSRSRNPLGASALPANGTFTYIYPAGTGIRPHAPTSVDGRAFSYDANGNLANDQSKTLVWDEANHLQSVTKGGATTGFAYGPDGAHSSKTSNFTGASVSTNYYGAEAEEKKGLFTRYPHMDVMVESSGGVKASVPTRTVRAHRSN